MAGLTTIIVGAATTILPANVTNCTSSDEEPQVCCAECAPEPVALWSSQWFLAASSALLCVIGAALAAGLTMGLTAQDLTALRIKKSIDPNDYEDEEQRQRVAKEKVWAGKVEPLVRRHHLLLVSLLLMNAGVNEALPIFLGQIVPEWLAVVLSVSFVLFFGEIIPSAILTGPNSLCIAAGLSWFVWCIIVVLFPLSWPIGKLLDLCLGEEHGMRTTFDPIETRVRLDLEAADAAEHEQHHGADVGGDGKSPQSSVLDYHKIMRGAVNLATATASAINTKHRSIANISCLSMDTVLDGDQLMKMMREGFSRYPVYEGGNPRNIRGILLTKSLILQNPERRRTVAELRSTLVTPVVVGPRTKLPDLLNQFQSGRCHMALVTARQSDVELVQDAPLPASALSHIITMEDLIEMILKETVLDETDNRIINGIGQIKHVMRKQKFMAKLKKRIIRKASTTGAFQLQPSSANRSAASSVDSRRVAPLASAKASTDGVDDGPVLSEALLPHAGGSSFVNPTIQAEIGNVFNQVDEDFDGKIDVADLRRAILFLLPSNRRKSGGGGGGGGGGGDGPDGAGGLEHPSPATARDVLDLAEELMSDWDADGDMRLTIGEFQTALESLLSQDYNQDARLDDELSELFKVIDVDQNDQITASELHAVVTHAMTDDDVMVTMEDVSRMFPTTDDSQAMNQAQFKDAIRRIYNMDISRHSE